jgi:hypothetical protein
VKKATIPSALIKFSKCIGSVDKIGPEFSENNEEIYCKLLGYSKEDLKKWKQEKVI